MKRKYRLVGPTAARCHPHRIEAWFQRFNWSGWMNPSISDDHWHKIGLILKENWPATWFGAISIKFGLGRHRWWKRDELERHYLELNLHRVPNLQISKKNFVEDGFEHPGQFSKNGYRFKPASNRAKRRHRPRWRRADSEMKVKQWSRRETAE